MTEKNHLPTTEFDNDKINSLTLAKIQQFSHKETTWDKILKYCLLPSIPFIMIAILTAVMNFVSSYSDIKVLLAKIDMRLDAIERRLDNTDAKLNDYEYRLRHLERK